MHLATCISLFPVQALLLRFIFEYAQIRQIVLYLLKCRQDCLPVICYPRVILGRRTRVASHVWNEPARVLYQVRPSAVRNWPRKYLAFRPCGMPVHTERR